MRAIALLFLFLICIQSPALMQSDPVVIDRIVRAATIVDWEYTLEKPMFSPDGTKMAWLEVENGICILDFTQVQVLPICADNPWSTDRYGQHFGTLAGHTIDWSGDSRYLTFSEDPFGASFYDSDIRVFDTTTLSFQNLTEDNISTIRPPSAAQNIDYYPLWNPTTPSIFFFRYRLNLDFPETLPFFVDLELWRVDVATMASEMIYRFDESSNSQVLATAVSPDGERLAMYLYQAGAGIESTLGLQVLDIADASMQMVASYEDFAHPNFDWRQVWLPRDRQSLLWTADGTALIMGSFTVNRGEDLGYPLESIRNFHFIDLEAGTVTALVDYPALTVENTDVVADQMPRHGVICGDQFVFTVGRRNAGRVNYTTVPFGEIYTADTDAYRGLSFPEFGALTQARNGRAILNSQEIMFLTC